MQQREAIPAAAECHKTPRAADEAWSEAPTRRGSAALWLGGPGLGVDIEPPPLWGTFAPEACLQSWARELGLAQLRQVRLDPEVVALAGVEGAKLRAAVRHVLPPTHSTR